MRLRLVAVLAFAFSLHSQPAPELDEALARAARERKPVIVVHGPVRAVEHPSIQRRVPDVVLVMRRSGNGAIAVLDTTGRERARWEQPVDVITLAAILDNAVSAAPDFEKAAAKGPDEGGIEAAIGLAKLGKAKEARETLNRALTRGRPETRQHALVAKTILEYQAEKASEALATLERVTREPLNAEIAATAWIAIGYIRRAQDDLAAAMKAYEKAVELADPDTPTGASAATSLKTLREFATSQQRGPIRIVPIQDQIVTGRRRVRTVVGSADVARVHFSVDGKSLTTVERPPFSTVVDFGHIPLAQTVRAVAHDARGKPLGRAEFVVNDGGETFWLRMTEPAEGHAAGSVRVTTLMRTPPGHRVLRMVVSWNDAQRAVLTNAPWQAEVNVPDEVGILRTVAELDDGRVAEDAVLLNATGYSERSDVPLVELPVTIKGGAAAAADIDIREGPTRRAVESITSGTDSPLTVGLVIDTSDSMHHSLPDVQEAAIRFLETALGPKDRAFLVSFSSEARLLQMPTTERGRLARQILALRPDGYTALYDAMILGLLQFEGVKGRRALIVFSDGGDRTSRYKKVDVGDLARRSNIPIYFIAARPPSVIIPVPSAVSSPAPRPGRSGEPLRVEPKPVGTMSAIWAASMAELERVVGSTGGRIHRLFNLGGLAKVYEDIEADLRAQSLVVIRTDAGKSENDWRKIDVSVAGRADVRAPAGYYAPW